MELSRQYRYRGECCQREQDGRGREERRDRTGRVLAQVDILTRVPLYIDCTCLIYYRTVEVKVIAVPDY